MRWRNISTRSHFPAQQDFLHKYKDKTNEDQIIGHFGLGFYSAFMVADEVHIDTLSYKEGRKAGTLGVRRRHRVLTWRTGTRQKSVPTITLFLNEDSLEFANEYRASEVIEKYCSFMPVEIFLAKANAEPEYETIDEDELTR